MAISKVISIEINDLNTRLCEVSYNKKTPKVYQTILFNNPEGSVEDSVVIDSSRYTEEFKAQLRAARIKCKDAVFIISGNRVLSREVVIPEMKDKLIDEYIDGEKESYFPMDISAHILSYTIIDRDSKKRQMRVNVYAAPETIVNSYNALAAELGLHIAALDCSGNAIIQFLQRNKASAIEFYLQINENNSLLTILDNGKLALQRNMRFGTASLVEHLIDEAYYGELSYEQAAMKLETDALIYSSYAEMMDYMPVDEAGARLHECKKRMTEAVRPLIAGFTRVLEYYNVKNKNANISKVYIGGCGSKIKNLDVLIMSEFDGITVEAVNVLPNIRFAKKDKLMEYRSTEFTSCIGASAFSIDFSRIAAADDKKSARAFAVLAGVLTLAAVIVLMGTAIITYKSALDEREQLNSDIASLQKIADLRESLDTTRSKLNDIKKFDESTVTKNEDWNKILDQLEAMLPSDTLVSSLTSNETGLNMIITVPGKKEAAKLLVQLKSMSVFEDVQIASLSETDDEATGVKNVSFTVTCTFKQTDKQTEMETPSPAADAQSGDSPGDTAQ